MIFGKKLTVKLPKYFLYLINWIVIRYFVRHNYTGAWIQINESFFKNLMGGDYFLAGDDRRLSPASNLWRLSYIIFLLNKNYYKSFVVKSF